MDMPATSAQMNAFKAFRPDLGTNVPQNMKEKLREKANEFEAYYIQQFIQLTRPDFSDNEVFGGGNGERMFSQQMDEQLANTIVKQGGFGISHRVYAELLRAQEGSIPLTNQGGL